MNNIVMKTKFDFTLPNVSSGKIFLENIDKYI